MIVHSFHNSCKLKANEIAGGAEEEEAILQMWEGRPIDSINGWPIFENGESSVGIPMSTSLVMNCSSSPKFSTKENHTNSLQHLRYTERNKTLRISDETSDQVKLSIILIFGYVILRLDL
uniref:Uncharacterized protein n=1 Tax=Elaeophora elaphi TaxID=1147741 RepID=A0A0R3RKJ5_9BILA